VAPLNDADEGMISRNRRTIGCRSAGSYTLSYRREECAKPFWREAIVWMPNKTEYGWLKVRVNVQTDKPPAEPPEQMES
jgi:hypothetical protein